MFLLRRPTASQIEEFITESRGLQLSYDPIGIVSHPPAGFRVDEACGVVGQGPATFERAKQALRRWRHFELGWVELFPKEREVEPEATVAVLVHHLGFWSLNGCRVVSIPDDGKPRRFGFSYVTLTNHSESGEESFEVSFSPKSEEVLYAIKAVSKPRATLAWMGYPIARSLQARFRRDSIRAMRRAVNL